LTPKPIIHGSPTYGQTLTAEVGNWDSGSIVALQWQRDGIAINGQVEDAYKPTADDVGHTISLLATGMKQGYVAAQVGSDQVNIAPQRMAVTKVIITGIAKVGKH